MCLFWADYWSGHPDVGGLDRSVV